MTDAQIMAMDDTVFAQTAAFRTFHTKEMFIRKIVDVAIRRKMLNLTNQV